MEFKKLPMNLQLFADPNDGGKGDDGNQDPNKGGEDVISKITSIVDGFGKKLDGFQTQINDLGKQKPKINEPKDDDHKDTKPFDETKFVSVEDYNKLKQQVDAQTQKDVAAELTKYAKDKAKEAGLTLDKSDFDLIKGDSKESIDAKIKTFADYNKRLADKFGNPDLPKKHTDKQHNDNPQVKTNGGLRDLSKYQTTN